MRMWRSMLVGAALAVLLNPISARAADQWYVIDMTGATNASCVPLANFAMQMTVPVPAKTPLIDFVKAMVRAGAPVAGFTRNAEFAASWDKVGGVINFV